MAKHIAASFHNPPPPNSQFPPAEVVIMSSTRLPSSPAFVQETDADNANNNRMEVDKNVVPPIDKPSGAAEVEESTKPASENQDDTFKMPPRKHFAVLRTAVDEPSAVVTDNPFAALDSLSHTRSRTPASPGKKSPGSTSPSKKKCRTPKGFQEKMDAALDEQSSLQHQALTQAMGPDPSAKVDTGVSLTR